MKKWNIKNTVVPEQLTEYTKNHILSVLLVNRGIVTKSAAEKFLNPLKMPITTPDVFCDMPKAIQRIRQAIDNNEKIIVYGDFDTDGITSTALLYLTLKKTGADVDFYIPDRSKESHGLNNKALITLISKKHAKLIITVDCGISNVNEVKLAQGFKTDIIITDHHEAPEILPNAYAIINPKAKNSLLETLSVEDIQSLNYLAGVGVAFKLSCALLEDYSEKDFAYTLLPLVAIGTIGDIVPLQGENRCFVEMGLNYIRNGEYPNIQKLIKSTGIENIKELTSEFITFSIVPRLNASGRLGSAEKALKLLITDNQQETDEIITLLNELNIKRQKMCDETYEQAIKVINSNPEKYVRNIVLFNENWHVGIIGIVASKLVEIYNKPVFLMTRDEYDEKLIRCSCRSVNGIDIHKVLSSVSENFSGFGGHAMAAGFGFNEESISFNKIKEILDEAVYEFSQGVDFIPEIDIDMEIEPEQLTISLIQQINKMQPFGADNPAPLFALNDTVLKKTMFMGTNQNHLKFFVEKGHGQIFECVKWNTPDFDVPTDTCLNIAFAPKINEFNGNVSLQLDIKDLVSEYIEKKKKNNPVIIVDNRKKIGIFTQIIDYLSTTKKQTALYIENKELVDKFMDYDLNCDIFNANSIPENVEQIMLFDCPKNIETFIEIYMKTKPKVIHLMHNDYNKVLTDDFITKLSGMLKYAVHNKNGVVDINVIAELRNVLPETVLIALKLLQDVNMISYEIIDDEMIKIDFKSPVGLSEIKNNVLYLNLADKISDLNDFRNKFVNGTVDEIKEIIV